jgi:phosphoglucosamine mutase
MNPETVAGLTHALVSMQMEAGAGNVAVVGYDTRPSGPELERAAVAGAVAAGATVLRLGVAPTPAILKTAQTEGAGAAVSLSASHNEWPDNGWKGTLGEDKPFGPEVRTISDRYWHQVDGGLIIPLDKADAVPERPELRKAYLDSVITDMEAQFGERPLDGKVVVVDGANGAAKDVTPELLGRLGATVHTYACDGKQPINEGSGATDLTGVQQYLRDHPEIARSPNFIGVVGQDGDADRMIAQGVTVQADGQLAFQELEGNRVMELQAMGQPGIVGTHYTNDAMVSRLRSKGTGFEFCDAGDVNVTNALRATKNTKPEPWTRGGEMSGHHVDLNWLSSGDGVRIAAWTAAYAATNGTTFAELCDKAPIWPERMVKVRLEPHLSEHILGDAAVTAAIADAETALRAVGGRPLVRTSGTEKGVVRVWGVGEDGTHTAAAVDGIAHAIKTRAAQLREH